MTDVRHPYDSELASVQQVLKTVHVPHKPAARALREEARVAREVADAMDAIADGAEGITNEDDTRARVSEVLGRIDGPESAGDGDVGGP